MSMLQVRTGMTRNKETPVEKVEEEVKEAVEETRAAWRALLRPRVIITTIIFLLLVVACFFAFKLYITITADLTIMLLPNEGYLSLENDEAGVVGFELQANNYLFCSALCSAQLLYDGSVVSEEKNILLRNSNHNLSFLLSAPSLGEGKEVYSLTVSCVNQKSLLCGRDATPVRESALITLDYTLSGDARSVFDSNFPEFLSLLSSAETTINEAIAYHRVLGGFNSRLAADITLLDVLISSSSDLRQAILSWSYPAVPLAGAFVLNESSSETLDSLRTAYLLEERRLSLIANLSIDSRISGLLNDSALSADWQDFVSDYSLARGSDLPLRYLAFVDEAEELLVSQLLSFNWTNYTLPTSFSEQWDDYCSVNCSLYPVNKSDARISLLPPFSESTLSLSYHHAKPVCTACSDGLPVLFLHGHSMYDRNNPEWSLGTFTDIVASLDDVVLDAGVLTPYSATVPFPASAWAGLPVAVRGTYYYDTYLSGGSYVLSWEQSESIDTYAIRVKELVDTLRIRTGESQVVIVAHSMGGLVARRYVQLFGDSAVASLVLVAPPNEGVSGRVAGLCPWLGEDKECREISAGSAMLARINDPSRQSSVPITVIYGTGCDMDGVDGDGVVVVESSVLFGAENIEVAGSCSGSAVLHVTLLDPSLYPAVVEVIKEILTAGSAR